nr:MAG TPA: hypothetical protein [Caudoviricetes sp.]
MQVSRKNGLFLQSLKNVMQEIRWILLCPCFGALL